MEKGKMNRRDFLKGVLKSAIGVGAIAAGVKSTNASAQRIERSPSERNISSMRTGYESSDRFFEGITREGAERWVRENLVSDSRFIAGVAAFLARVREGRVGPKDFEKVVYIDQFDPVLVPLRPQIRWHIYPVEVFITQNLPDKNTVKVWSIIHAERTRDFGGSTDDKTITSFVFKQ